MLEVRNLSLTYGAESIIKNASFSCNTDKIVITGCSGSGKSSLLHLISGLQSNYNGDIYWAGNNIRSMTLAKLLAWRRHNLGFVFQQHNLLQDFTVLENVMLPNLLIGLRKDEARAKAQALLSDLDMSNKIGKKISQLSGGEKQRVAIARAIVHQPRLVIADEPTGALDPKLAQQAIDRILVLAKNSGVILVTHNMSLVAKFERHFIIDAGELVEANLAK